MGRGELERLSKAELIELVLRLQRPEKTSRTSSKPPSTDRKEQREKAKPGGAKLGHEGHSRTLSERADRVVDHRPAQCPCCQAALASDLPAEPVSVHDRVEVPEVKPVIERHRRLAVRCPACGSRGVAAVPSAASGTPFVPRLHPVPTYLKTFQALSYERLQGALADLFGLTISQGGLMNLLRRAQGHFQTGRYEAVAALRRATVVASDETGVRIAGANAYHWVFCSPDAVVHQAAPTRAHRRHHGPDAPSRSAGLLARDVAYAREASEDPVPWRLELWLRSAFDLAGAITTFAASTLVAKRRALERRLAAILKAPTTCDLARDLQRKFRRARDQLLTFVAFRGAVEVTNNACERALRPAVVQRKVTNGYRAMWAAEGEAAVRTVVDTARLGPGTSPFSTILKTVGA